MKHAKWDLYIGFPVDLNEETKQMVIDAVNTRHPDSQLHAILDGYWSGVNEDTLQIKFESKEEFAQTTVKIIQAILNSGFAWLCEAEN
jgi:hypothetical protein